MTHSIFSILLFDDYQPNAFNEFKAFIKIHANCHQMFNRYASKLLCAILWPSKVRSPNNHVSMSHVQLKVARCRCPSDILHCHQSALAACTATTTLALALATLSMKYSFPCKSQDGEYGARARFLEKK